MGIHLSSASSGMQWSGRRLRSHRRQDLARTACEALQRQPPRSWSRREIGASARSYGTTPAQQGTCHAQLSRTYGVWGRDPCSRSQKYG